MAGKSKLVLYRSEYFRGIVRMLQVSPEFDRIMLAVGLRVPFGSVSRVISQLENEGYVTKTDRRVQYNSSTIKQNPDFAQEFRLNYGSGNVRSATTYVKTAKWAEFMKRWRAFLLEEQQMVASLED